MRLVAVLLVTALGGVVAAEGAAPVVAGTIVYSSAGGGEDWELYAFPAAGGARANISANRDSDVRALVSPDGTRIAFERGVDRLGGSRLVVARSNGTAQKELPFAYASFTGWAPDSRRLLVVQWLKRERRHRVMVFDVDSGAQTTVGFGIAARWSADGRTVAFLGPVNDNNVGSLYVAEPGSAPVLVGLSAERSFAWSPDGKRLAYGGSTLRVYDMATRSSAEVNAIRVDGRLGWSPDGARIYVRSDRNLVSVAASGGDLRRLVSAIDDFVVSPDGQRIVIRQDVEIVLWGPGGIQKLGRAASPAWSPSGRELAFVRGGISGFSDTNELAVLDVATGEMRTLFKHDEFGAIADPVWRPDGSAVLAASFTYSSQDDLFVVSADGSGRQRLGQTTENEQRPRWSPDGSMLAFERWGVVEGRVVLEGVYITDLSTRRVRRLARNAAEPAWSPDGSQITFTMYDDEGSTGIALVRADGTGRRVLTKQSDASPTWSPDGKTIAFTREGDYGELIFLLDLSPRRITKLLDPGSTEDDAGTVEDLQWSPDGTRLAFVHGEDEEPYHESQEPQQLVVVNLRGKVLSRQDVPYWSYGYGFAWSPDGKHFAHGGSDVAITRAGGRTVRTLRVQNANRPNWSPLCSRTGGAGADRLAGSPRDDVICALGGNDRVDGGRGEDRLFGGEGNDVVAARDGAFDVVGCGPGRDIVTADWIDLVGVDCERVTRG